MSKTEIEVTLHGIPVTKWIFRVWKVVCAHLKTQIRHMYVRKFPFKWIMRYTLLLLRCFITHFWPHNHILFLCSLAAIKSRGLTEIQPRVLQDIKPLEPLPSCWPPALARLCSYTVWLISWRHNSKSCRDNLFLKKDTKRYWKYIL